MTTPRRLAVVLGAVALGAHPSFAAGGRTWTVAPEGVTFEMSASDVRAWRGAATGPPVFAVSALLAAEKRKFDADAKERARELANSERPQMGDNTMDDSTSFEVLSIVGPLVSYRHSSYAYSPGAAHPTGFNVVQVADVSHLEASPSLLDFYPERTLLAALKADPWIRKFENPETDGFEKAASLPALLAALDPQWAQENAAGDDHDCAVDVSFDVGIFKTFSFHHVAKGRVAVRIEVPPGTEWCNRAGGPQPIGLLLPIPDALRAHLAKAQKGEAGFLTANVKAESRTYSEHWEVDLSAPLPGTTSFHGPRNSPRGEWTARVFLLGRLNPGWPQPCFAASRDSRAVLEALAVDGRHRGAHRPQVHRELAAVVDRVAEAAFIRSRCFGSRSSYQALTSAGVRSSSGRGRGVRSNTSA